VTAQNGQTGWLADATVQATAMEPLPISVYANASLARPDSKFANDRNDTGQVTSFFGVQPTGADNLLFYESVFSQKAGARWFDGAFPFIRPNDTDLFSTNAGAAWSHTFGERNVLQAMVAGSTIDQDLHRTDPFLARDGAGNVLGYLGLDTRQRLREK